MPLERGDKGCSKVGNEGKSGAALLPDLTLQDAATCEVLEKLHVRRAGGFK